jgi:hypothetical protein
MARDSDQYFNAVPDKDTQRAFRYVLSQITGSDVEGYPFWIDEAFTTAITIAADGTTGINITSAFTGTTGFLFAGTATNGISITGACTTAFDVTGAFTTGISIAANGTTGVEISSAFTGTTGFLLAGTATDAISVTGACTDGVDLSGAMTNYFNVNNVATTGGVGVHFIDAFLGKAIETGTYQSTASGGITLTSTNTRPVSFLFDDAGVEMGAGSDVRATVSRVLLTVDHTNASTINALRGQLKANDLVDMSSATGVRCATMGYLELAGTGARTVAGYTAAIRASIEEGASGTTTVSGSSFFSGVESNLSSGRSYTLTGEMAAFATTATSTADWDIGLLVSANSCTNGIEVQACTTGINITGATTTGVTVSGTASGDGILVSGACADGIHISGTNTASGLHVSGDQVVSVLIDVDAAVTAAAQVKVDDGITADYGLDISRTGTTGICTTGIRIDTDGTTGIDITSGFTGVTGITFAGTASGDGILVSGACADGIQVSGTNTATAIHVSGTQVIGLQFEGTYSDSAITIGTSGSPISLAAQPDHAIDIYTTSPSTDAGNSVRPIHMTSTMTGIGGVGGRAEFEMTSNVALGGWANSLKGYFNMGDACTVTGLGSAVLAELKLPGASLGGVGSYAVMEMELVTQASGLTGGAPVAFQWMQVSGDGTATADFEDNGSLMVIKGLTEGSGNIFSAGADVVAAATLRILVGATPYYILLGAGEST